MPDEEVIYTYLRGLDPNVGIALATRDALRVLPGITFSRDMGGSPVKGIRGQGQFDRIALPTFRALLTALVMLKRGSDGFEEFANSSATSIKEVFETIKIERLGSRAPPSINESAASLCAAETVLAARQDGNSIEHAIQSLKFSQNLFVRRFKTELEPGEFPKMTMNDVIDLESWEIEEQSKYPGYDMRLAKLTTDHVTSQPPWATGDVRDGLNDEALYSMRLHLDADPNKWNFWKRWHDDILNGNQVDWDLLENVAVIPDEDWKKGPEWVAGKIAEIERNFLSKRAPLAETIEFNPETNKFHAIPLDVAKPDLVAATLSQLSDALEDVLANPSNGLTSKSREVRVAQRTLNKYADDPQQVELNLVSVAVGLRRQLFDTAELPETEENLALLQTAEDGAVAIRATHPAVAENREILAQQKFVELSDADKAVLGAAIEPLLLLSEWQIADDFAEDIPALLNTSVGPSGDYAPPLPGVTRTFGRIARISEHAERSGIIEKLEKSRAVRATLMASGFSSLAALLWPLVQMGLRLFGVP